jgi:hypothetical protein
VHRYFVGKGQQGRENIEKVKQYIETIQDWRKSEDTGIVSNSLGIVHLFSLGENLPKEISGFQV